MKLNKLFMLGLVGLAFTACSNEDEIPGAGKQQDKAVIKLALGSAQTRSLSQSAARKYNTINSLEVHFYNAQGNFVEVPETVEGDADYSKADAIKSAVDELKSGKTQTHLEIKGVPKNVTQVYIVANQPAGNKIETSSLDNARHSVVFLRSQNSLNASEEFDFKVFSGENSTLTGLGEVDVDGNATVKLIPVPSRMEVGGLKAVKAPATWGGVEIQSFAVRGIYVNQFYPWGRLIGTDNNALKIANGSVPENYTKEAYKKISYTYNGVVGDHNYAFMCDEPASSDVVAGAAAPDIWSVKPVLAGEFDQYWGYQVLPGDVPNIVVKLDVTYADGKVFRKFLTIQKYRLTEPIDGIGEAGAVLPRVDRGYVYRMNIDFDASDLTDVPYEGTKTFSALITVADWQPVGIAPDFD